MKALFGVVSLLIALAIVGFVAVKQLRAVGHVSVEPSGGVNAAAPAGTTVREQSQRLQDKVRDDVVKALEQGAAARKDESEK
jgi:sorbitol-specific phosphotransferase system component IIA